MAGACSPNCFEKLLVRKALYKVKTPPWKETFRKRCLEGLKARRQKLHDQFRQVPQNDLKNSSFITNHENFGKLVEEVIEEEWNATVGSKNKFPSLLYKGLDIKILEESDETDEIISTLEEIQAELIKEEQQLQKLEEKEQVEQCHLEWLQRDEVICPVCQRNPLTESTSVISCSCGLQITSEYSHLPLQKFQEQLNIGLTQHANNCTMNPNFSLTSMYGITNLLLLCEVQTNQYCN
ncbi:RPA-interacting protein A-like isoform X2 [Tachypleus tridentatus]|uniref:RPA-interacting protein A-like isoform X2 n=1 Tax=Tachypleus tridentatus TaxID=6853 RepID=UPI003FD3691C